MPGAPRETLGADAAAQLADFARTCKAAARAVSLYPGQHPSIAASLARLAEATARLTASGPLQLRVMPDTLLIGDAAPPKPDQAIRELAGLLHSHQIGAITINAGAETGSWQTLLLLLSRLPEDVRADGGIAQLWATAGGPSVELREIDYAEVLREKEGTAAALDDIIAAALDGTQIRLDDDNIDALLGMLADPDQLDELMARLESAARALGSDAKAAAVVKLLQNMADRARAMGPQELEATLRQLGRVASRLSADDMLQLLAYKDSEPTARKAVTAVLDRMEDAEVARFVAGSVIAEHGASGRLAHAFQALVPDADRQRHLLALAQEEVAASPLGEDATFEELWGKVESMVTSYSDADYVSETYAQELTNIRAHAVDLERTSDDPPQRIAAWVSTVSDTALRELDHELLADLLAVEEDPARWRDVAETTVAHADDLVRVGHFDQAWRLADVVIREAEKQAARLANLPQILQRFMQASFMKHVAAHMRSADEETFDRFGRLCRAIGTPVIAPLAELLSAEQDARSRRRLRDVLVGFGAQGRDVVQQLMNSPNWEVRRTAAFLLREFGGAEGLRELIPLLTDSEPLVRREAVQGLVLNGSEAAARILVQTLDAAAGRERRTLVAELTSVRDRRASPFFCYLAQHLNRSRHTELYLSTLDTLGGFDDPEAIEALKVALHRTDFWAPFRTRRARAAAAAALGRIGTPAALDVLERASASGSRGARAAARAQVK
jgi:hypothetical protein